MSDAVAEPAAHPVEWFDFGPCVLAARSISRILQFGAQLRVVFNDGHPPTVLGYATVDDATRARRDFFLRSSIIAASSRSWGIHPEAQPFDSSLS